MQIDCAYFAMVTVTTTGYGDLTPRDKAEDHMFTVFYAFLGVAFISLVVKELTMVVARTVKETAKQARRKAVKATTMLLAADDDDLALKTQAVTQESSLLRALLTAKASEKNKLMRMFEKGSLAWYGSGIYSVFLNVIVCWAIGGGILVATDGMRFSDAFYCAGAFARVDWCHFQLNLTSGSTAVV